MPRRRSCVFASIQAAWKLMSRRWIYWLQTKWETRKGLALHSTYLLLHRWSGNPRNQSQISPSFFCHPPPPPPPHSTPSLSFSFWSHVSTLHFPPYFLCSKCYSLFHLIRSHGCLENKIIAKAEASWCNSCEGNLARWLLNHFHPRATFSCPPVATTEVICSTLITRQLVSHPSGFRCRKSLLSFPFPHSWAKHCTALQFTHIYTRTINQV